MVETGGAETPACTEHLDGPLVHQQIKAYRHTPYQPHIIALIGVLQTAVEVFDGRTTELYSDAHECILLWSC